MRGSNRRWGAPQRSELLSPEGQELWTATTGPHRPVPAFRYLALVESAVLWCFFFHAFLPALLVSVHDESLPMLGHARRIHVRMPCQRRSSTCTAAPSHRECLRSRGHRCRPAAGPSTPRYPGSGPCWCPELPERRPERRFHPSAALRVLCQMRRFSSVPTCFLLRVGNRLGRRINRLGTGVGETGHLCLSRRRQTGVA